MDYSFTQQAGHFLMNLLERDSYAIWESIDAESGKNDKSFWKTKIEEISQAYSLSSRFALMRFLYCRETGRRVSDSDTVIPGAGASFQATIEGTVHTFSDISLSHAAKMEPEESNAYWKYLTQIASYRTDYDWETCEYLVSRAWYDDSSADGKRQKTKTRLTQAEALQLGHMLGFSLEEMQWFLLRVFDHGDGFRFNQSDDVIEAYGFLTGASWQHVQELKEQYRQIQVKNPSQILDDRNSGWTKSVSDSLPARVSLWEKDADTMDAAFLAWLKELSPGLDIPSKTALRIYRNLAVFAYDLIVGEEYPPDEEDFEDCIQDVYSEPQESGAVQRLLYLDGAVSKEQCKRLADKLLLENKIQSASEQVDNANAWHVLTTRKDGKLTSAGGVNSSRTRVVDLLLGKEQAEKSDFLYLLWFIRNLVWEDPDADDKGQIQQRITGFISTADYLLEEAMLPHFYIPHILEQTMLLSIISGYQEEEDPAVVYEYILNAFKEHRERKQGSVRHDMQTKVQIVTEYMSDPTLSLEECALKYCISPKTLSAWQKTLLESGAVQKKT